MVHVPRSVFFHLGMFASGAIMHAAAGCGDAPPAGHQNRCLCGQLGGFRLERPKRAWQGVNRETTRDSRTPTLLFVVNVAWFFASHRLVLARGSLCGFPRALGE